jgi:hypothetical protein
MDANQYPDHASGIYGGVAVLERPDPKLLRLAALVMHLTESTAELAWVALAEAVETRGYPETHDECLARVARAMGSIRCRLDLR